MVRLFGKAIPYSGTQNIPVKDFTAVTETDYTINNLSHMNLNELINLKYVVASVLYSVLGILILFFAFWIVERVTPENLWKEILEKQNIALAIVFAAFIIAIAIIVSSSIHG